MKKIKLYDKLIHDGWFNTKEEIIPWVMARKVLVNDYPAQSFAELISPDANIRVKEYYKRKYVSKGGLKLEHAITTFGINVFGRIALDCGASTGGFTDCLLAFGAQMVYAVDVGFGQLASKLMNSDRVVNFERTNISSNKLQYLDPKPNLITLDLSYLSLKDGIHAAQSIIDIDGDIIALIKPIYETREAEVRRNGDVNQADIHCQVINELVVSCQKSGLYPCNLTYSPVRGNSGAVEYFLHISISPTEIINSTRIPVVVDKGLRLPLFKK